MGRRRVTAEFSPSRWAFQLTHVLNAAYGESADRYPVNVIEVAKAYSAQLFPDDPISAIQGADLSGFDGALCKAPPGKKGWGILYNSGISSPGRINFTLGHEFGHYLLHRLAYPEGIQCGAQDMIRWDEYQQIEQQANEFAVNLLMPLDDFRKQIGPKAKPTLDELGMCADRYKVSLIAATLRWLQYTQRRSILVVSREGYILWARSSDAALKTGAYFKTSGRPPIEIPAASLPMSPGLLLGNRGYRQHEADVWLAEPCEEIALVSDQYDFAISLLHLERAVSLWDKDEEEQADTFDVIARRSR